MSTTILDNVCVEMAAENSHFANVTDDGILQIQIIAMPENTMNTTKYGPRVCWARCSLFLEFLKNSWNSWKTPGIPEILLEYLKNSWNTWKTPGISEKLLEFWNFLPEPWKPPGKTINFLVLLENSKKFFVKFITKAKTCRRIWIMIVLFVFYVDSILVAATVVLFLPREILGVGS